MATTNTVNYQLIKPTPGTQQPVIVATHINGNWDIIDTQLKRVDDKALQNLFIRKLADESVTSNTTLQDDDELFLAVAANSIYKLNCWFPFSGVADPAGGFKPQFTVPAAATLHWTAYGANQGAPTSYDVVYQTSAGAARLYATNSGTIMSMAPRGTLVTGANAGVLRLQWAQAISNATPTVLKAQAWIELVKEA